MLPTLTHQDYAGDLYRGKLSEDAFYDALPAATARLVELTGTDVPTRYAEAWKRALCALVDRVGGLDGSGRVASETVGSTSITYADAVIGTTDYDAVVPYLSGTGLLYMGLA